MSSDSNSALDINEAADFLGAHPQTVRKLARSGEIPSFKVGRAWRFHRSALQAWVDTHHQRNIAAHVLVVDDEANIRKTLDLILTKAGYRVSLAASGVEAVEIAKRDIPDLAVVDLVLPDLNGGRVLKELHAMNPDLPVIIMTGYPDSNLMQEALQYFPLTVISKPIPSKTLTTAILRTLGMRAKK